MTAVRPHPAPAPPSRRAPALPPVRLGPVLVAITLALGLLEVLWLGVVMDAGLAVADPLVTGWWVQTRSSALVAAARVVTTGGGPAPMLVLLVLVAAVLSARRRSWQPAVSAAGGAALLAVVDVGVKTLLARPRPPLVWHAVSADGWSFPSGHATFSAGVMLLVVWMAAPRGALRRAVAVAAAATVTLLVGLSRLVLGVHYPSDVLAGWCLAVIADGAVLVALALVRHRGR